MHNGNSHPWLALVAGLVWLWVGYYSFHHPFTPEARTKPIPKWLDIHAGRNYALESRIVGVVALCVGLFLLFFSMWMFLHP
jgi:hypothetical protein